MKAILITGDNLKCLEDIVIDNPELYFRPARMDKWMGESRNAKLQIRTYRLQPTTELWPYDGQSYPVYQEVEV